VGFGWDQMNAGGMPVVNALPLNTFSGNTPDPLYVAAQPPRDYAATFAITADPSGHGPFINMPSSLTLTVSHGNSTISITGPAPFVPVSGTLLPDGSFSAAGTGTVAGNSNTLVEMNGSLSGGVLSATYMMGTNGALPGGQAITYGVTATRQ